MDCSTPGFPVFIITQSLLKLLSIESVMPSNRLTLCCPLLLLPLIFPSIRVFSSESTLCIRWPTYWSFSISPSNEYSELISFRIEWFDLLAVQGTLNNSIAIADNWRERKEEWYLTHVRTVNLRKHWPPVSSTSSVFRPWGSSPFPLIVIIMLFPKDLPKLPLEKKKSCYKNS